MSVNISKKRIKTYSRQQRVKLVPIECKSKRSMYSYLERYIGKEGIVIDSYCIEFALTPNLYIYTIKFMDGDLVQVPKEMLAIAGPTGES